jgi:hypothetical protein
MLAGAGPRRKRESVADQRRLHQRFTIELPVVFVVGGTTVKGRTENISLGGLLAALEGPVPFGAEVVVRITLPASAEELELPATVRWTRETSTGVQFSGLRAKATWALNQLFKTG